MYICLVIKVVLKTRVRFLYVFWSKVACFGYFIKIFFATYKMHWTEHQRFKNLYIFPFFSFVTYFITWWTKWHCDTLVPEWTTHQVNVKLYFGKKRNFTFVINSVALAWNTLKCLSGELFEVFNIQIWYYWVFTLFDQYKNK